MPGAAVEVLRSWVDPAMAQRFFDQLKDRTPWRQDSIVIYGKEVLLPRLTAWYGDEGASYSYSGIPHAPLDWTGPLASLRKALETATGGAFNSVLLNYYRSGADAVGWHSDNEPELGPTPTIASLSLGASRKFSFKPKQGTAPAVSLDLHGGDLLVMSGATQKNWLHQVPKTSRPVGERINLTFRLVRPWLRQ